jgi:hypothetical protein
VPSLAFTGTGTVLNTTQAVTVGALTAGAVTATGLTVNGTAGVTGALTAGAGSNIGGATFSGGVATTPTAASSTAGGFVSGTGHFYGDGSAAIVRQRNATTPFAWGAPYLGVYSDRLEVTGGPMNVRSGLTVSDTTISYYSGGTFRGYYAVGFYGDPGVSVAPEGSILVT